MLLNNIILLIATFAVGFSSSHALALEAGKYELMEGPAHLCSDFEISQKQLGKKFLSVNSRYGFVLDNNQKQVESDIDPQCVFKEINSKVEDRDELTLTRKNLEFCKGKLMSKTISKAIIKTNEIDLSHQVEDAPIYHCRWQKK